MDNEYEEVKVVCLHLVDGNEVIGRYLSENDRGIDVEDAMLIRYGMNQQGNYVFYFNKYCPYDKEFYAYFKKSVVVTIHRDVLDFVKEHYLRAAEKMRNINYDSIMNDMIEKEETYEPTIDLEDPESIEEVFSEFFKKPNKKLH